MTRKDYVLIASTIKEAAHRIADATCEIREDQLRGVRRTAAHLADAFDAENPRFDMQRFLKACGYA
jgi:hypothetical protein